MIFKKTVLVIALASLLVACGGGGETHQVTLAHPILEVVLLIR